MGKACGFRASAFEYNVGQFLRMCGLEQADGCYVCELFIANFRRKSKVSRYLPIKMTVANIASASTYSFIRSGFCLKSDSK